MLRTLVATSLKQPVLVLALAAVLLAGGFYRLRDAPLDVFPEFAPPLIEIQTEAPGLSTDDVESLVTTPIENALHGVGHVKTLRSKSVLGLSSVVLLFEPGVELPAVRQQVQERLAALAAELPESADPPVILSPLSSTSRVMKIGLWSDTKDQMELSELARWTIRPRLMAVEGVANVAIWGERRKQFQVLVDPERLRAHGLTLAQIELAAAEAASTEGGGFVDTPNQRLAVRRRNGIESAADLGQAVIPSSGAPLRLNDVALVRVGHAPPIGDAIINCGEENQPRPGLLLIVEKQPTGNTLSVSHGVEQALESLKPALAGVELDATIFRPATFIERALRNLSWSMAIGCGLVVLVLGLFLFDWRTALISATAIPLSLTAAALALVACGATMNTMVLAGLVIALGEVVDDAIIDVENIVRRLRMNRCSAIPRTPFRVVLEASLEVRGAVVYGSLTVMLVIMPVFFLEGLAGAFFRPLALAYVLAILASLAVALTVTPALALLLLPGVVDRRRESPLVRWLKRPYAALLPNVAPRGKICLALVLAAVAVCGASVWRFDEQFLPNFKETDFLMHWVEKPGTSIEAMDRVTADVSVELRGVPGVRNFGSHIGRAEVADEVYGPNFTELWISMQEEAPYDATVAKVQTIVDGYPGLYRDLQTYLRERIKEVLTGASATIVVRIFGDDLAELRRQAAEVERVMSGVEGVKNLKIEQQVLVPQIEVRLRPEAAAQHELTQRAVGHALSTLVKGAKAGEIYDRQRVFDVVVWSSPQCRSDESALRELLVETPAGGRVPLGDVADVSIRPAPNEIKRERASRRIDVTCEADGRDLGAVAREIETRVGALKFPDGYRPEFLGEYAAQKEARQRMLILGALAAFGIVLVIYAEFRCWRTTVVVLASFLFAFIGGVAGAWRHGGVISLGSLVGFVTVVGLAVRNGIMMVSHFRHLEEKERQPFGVDLVVRGAVERLAPITMTALTTALALLPLILAGERPGNEIEHPMAWVILGGLTASTLLTLLVTPALYLTVCRPASSPSP